MGLAAQHNPAGAVFCAELCCAVLCCVQAGAGGGVAGAGAHAEAGALALKRAQAPTPSSTPPTLPGQQRPEPFECSHAKPHYSYSRATVAWKRVGWDGGSRSA